MQFLPIISLNSFCLNLNLKLLKHEMFLDKVKISREGHFSKRIILFGLVDNKL